MVGHGQVGLAVAVEITHRDGIGLAADGVVGLGLERAVAVAQQDAHRVAAVVGHGQVGLAVAVEIAHRDGQGRLPTA